MYEQGCEFKPSPSPKKYDRNTFIKGAHGLEVLCVRFWWRRDGVLLVLEALHCCGYKLKS